MALMLVGPSNHSCCCKGDGPKQYRRWPRGLRWRRCIGCRRWRLQLVCSCWRCLAILAGAACWCSGMKSQSGSGGHIVDKWCRKPGTLAFVFWRRFCGHGLVYRSNDRARCWVCRWVCHEAFNRGSAACGTDFALPPRLGCEGGALPTACQNLWPPHIVKLLPMSCLDVSPRAGLIGFRHPPGLG